MPVALVAGGSRGLGLLIARELHSRGYQVSIASRDPDALERAARDIGPGTDWESCDISDRDAVNAWVARVESELGLVSVVMVVAGIIQVGPAEDMTHAQFDPAIDVMIHGPINVVLAALPNLRLRHLGRIGIVTSVGGVVSPPHMWPYATAKFAQIGFSDGLASALSGTGVTATTIVPGLMRTGSQGRATFVGNVPAESRWFQIAASTPLLSVSGQRAARRMVDAVLAGRPLVTITPTAWLAFRVRGLLPGTTTRALGLANRMLPKATGNSEAVEGRTADEGQPAIVRWLSTLGRSAAVRNNET